MVVAVLVALHLVPLPGPDGQPIPINPDRVVSLRPAPGGIYHHKVRCVVHTDDGKFIAVSESCKRSYELLNTGHQ
jgi:hypothetical protein